jgi:hypothetical protein
LVTEFRIRGAAFRTARDEVLALVASGRLSREELHARLEPSEIALLDLQAATRSWYPVDAYDRLITTLMDLEGGGSSEYLVERGRRSVESLTAIGLQRSIESASRTLGSADRWWARPGPALVALPSAIYSESNWTLVPGEQTGSFTIEVTEAAEIPESLRYSLQGVLECLASRLIGAEIRVSSQRPAPDKLVFRGSPVE